jgi:hypothetical protein
VAIINSQPDPQPQPQQVEIPETQPQAPTKKYVPAPTPAPEPSAEPFVPGDVQNDPAPAQPDPTPAPTPEINLSANPTPDQSGTPAATTTDPAGTGGSSVPVVPIAAGVGGLSLLGWLLSKFGGRSASTPAAVPTPTPTPTPIPEPSTLGGTRTQDYFNKTLEQM